MLGGGVEPGERRPQPGEDSAFLPQQLILGAGQNLRQHGSSYEKGTLTFLRI